MLAPARPMALATRATSHPLSSRTRIAHALPSSRATRSPVARSRRYGPIPQVRHRWCGGAASRIRTVGRLTVSSSCRLGPRVQCRNGWLPPDDAECARSTLSPADGRICGIALRTTVVSTSHANRTSPPYHKAAARQPRLKMARPGWHTVMRRTVAVSAPHDRTVPRNSSLSLADRSPPWPAERAASSTLGVKVLAPQHRARATSPVHRLPTASTARRTPLSRHSA